MLLNFAAVKRFSYAGAELHNDKGHVKNAGKKSRAFGQEKLGKLLRGWDNFYNFVRNESLE